MTNAKISIIIAAYNAEEYIKETLQSIYAQHFDDFHIYVIDDGSTDKTAAIVAGYNDRITYVKQTNSGSPSGTRNKGIKLAESDYIAIFDADDIMLPNKISQQVDILDQNPDISLVFTDFQPFDDDDNFHQSWLQQTHIQTILAATPKTALGNNSYSFNHQIYREILRNNFIGTSTVVARKSDLISVGLFDETLAGAEDRDVWMKLAKAGKRFAYIDQALSKYRLSSNSLSHSMRFLESQVRYYKELLRSEKDASNRLIMRTRIAQRAGEYGWRLKNEGQFIPSMKYQLSSFYYGNLQQRLLATKNLLKLPIFILLSISKKLFK